MTPRGVLFCATMMCVLSACDSSRPTTEHPTGATSAADPGVPAEASSPQAGPTEPSDLPGACPQDSPEIRNECTEVRHAVAAILQGSSEHRCQQDGDCACLPAIVDCGGAQGRGVASRLAPLATRFASLGCEFAHENGTVFNCAPFVCRPICSEHGFCQN